MRCPKDFEFSSGSQREIENTTYYAAISGSLASYPLWVEPSLPARSTWTSVSVHRSQLRAGYIHGKRGVCFLSEHRTTSSNDRVIYLRKYDLGRPRATAQKRPSKPDISATRNHQKRSEARDNSPQLVPKSPPPSHYIVILTRLLCRHMHTLSVHVDSDPKYHPPNTTDFLPTHTNKRDPAIPPRHRTTHRKRGVRQPHHPAFIPNTSRSQDADSRSACHVQLGNFTTVQKHR